jgi:hypothetical protein
VAAEERLPSRHTAALLAAGAAYALGAAATRAFTLPADVLTALPIVVMAILVVVRWPLRPRRLQVPAPARAGHPFRPWVVLFAVVALWELYEYLARGSRGDHPTFSSMTDAVDRTYILKALVFFGWLCLGWCIVRAGARATSSAGTS